MIVAISGYSTAGKTFIAQILPPFEFAALVSHTTRPARPGEVDGLDYHYCSDSDFQHMIETEQLLEFTEFCGFKYGLSFKELNSAISNGKIAVHVCTPSGVTALREYSECHGHKFVSAFVEADLKVIINRMVKRLMSAGQEHLSYIVDRLATALVHESFWTEKFNFILCNSDKVAELAQSLVDVSRNRIEIPSEIERIQMKSNFTYEGVKDTLVEIMNASGRPSNPDQQKELVQEILKSIGNIYEH